MWAVQLPDAEVLDRVFVVARDEATQLAELAPSGRVERLETTTGPVVVVQGRRLHSGRDPEREANRWARELELSDKTILVLLGFGSGYAVRALRARTDVPIIVFEPDLEVLREGLTHGPIPADVVIVPSPERLSAYLTVILRGADRGVVLPWTPSLRCDPALYRVAMDAATEGVGRAKLRQQTALLRSRGWLRHYLHNLPMVCRHPPLSQLRGQLRGVPAVIVAAGPSLDKNVHLLRRIEDSTLVLTVNTAARALERAGVLPHALVSIESADVTSGIRSLPWLLDLPAFIELTGSPDVWALPFPHKVPISVDTNGCATFSKQLSPGLGLSAGFCVANTAVAVAHALGCDPIVLVGSDLAYAGDRVYATGTIFESMRAEDDGTGKVRLTGVAARRAIESASAEALGHNRAPDVLHTVELPAWDGHGSVRSTPDFKIFRDWYTYAAERLDVELVNATEGGAFIPGWRHEPLASVIERHGLARSDVAVPIRRQLDQLLVRGGLPSDQLRDAIVQERGTLGTVVALAREACEIVHHDPDGDLSIDAAAGLRLHEINAEARRLLRLAPLAQEACYAPIEHLRSRGDITTFRLYSAITSALAELDDELARMLQLLSTEYRQEVSSSESAT